MSTSNKKLQLNKQVVANLHNNELKQMIGGQAPHVTMDCSSKVVTYCGQCTDGCTDGCGIFHSWWNCTKANCTADCAQ
ncbi:MAG: class I lanthipeptide [Candidatus Limimorpha sp.]